MKQKATALMSGLQRQVLKDAYSQLKGASADTGDLLAPVAAARAAGWPRRSIAEALGIPASQTRRIAPASDAAFPRYRRGEPFPVEAVEAYTLALTRIAERKAAAGARMSALVRAAHGSGYSYNFIGKVLGTSGEWVRLLAEPQPDEGVPGLFTPAPEQDRPAPRPPAGRLSAEERARLLSLARRARSASRISGRRIPPGENEQDYLRRLIEARRASEELGALIIEAKGRRVSWADLDDACGYAPGSARARAKRHGYGSRPPSLCMYTPTPEELLTRAGLR